MTRTVGVSFKNVSRLVFSQSRQLRGEKWRVSDQSGLASDVAET
jgi:hypothetical protein